LHFATPRLLKVLRVSGRPYIPANSLGAGGGESTSVLGVRPDVGGSGEVVFEEVDVEEFIF
jgi:hypothetical protein